MTLPERLKTARLALGANKANLILSRLPGQFDRAPTLKAQVEALESALEERFAQTRTAPIAHADLKVTLDDATSRAEIPTAVQKLCANYTALTNDDDRRAFWQKNQKALSGKISGLAEICMAAAKPLSFRARAGLHFTASEGPPKFKMRLP